MLPILDMFNLGGFLTLLFLFILYIMAFFDTLLSGSWLPGALGGVADFLFGRSSQKAQTRDSVNAQKELMDYQQNMQKDYQSWLFQNQYPQQVSGMKAAGLNPAGANTNLAGVTASAPSAGSIIPSPVNPNFGANVQAFSQADMNRKQAELMESQANYYNKLAGKTEQETNLLSNENKYWLDNFNAQLDSIITKTHESLANTQLLEYKKNEVRQNINNLKAAESDLLASVGERLANVKLKEKEIKYYDDSIRSIIQQNIAQAGYLFGKNRREAESFMYELFNTTALTSYYDNQSALLDANKRLTDWTIKLTEKYGDAEKVVDMVSRTVSSIGTAVAAGAGAYVGVSKVAKPVHVKGF